VDRFDDVVPNWLTVSYLYDVGTRRVQQSEAVFWNWPSFDGWDSIEYLVSTLDRMAGRTIGPAGRQAIERIARGDSKAEFRSGQLRGQLERQDVHRIYLGVWEHGFHKR
jgi:serine/threonine-protein kinase